MRTGPLMAAADSATITVHGKGGHASRPHLCIDPIVVVSAIVMALQTIVSRSIDSTQTAVITVGTIRGGTATNVIAEEAEITLSIRTFIPEIRELVKERIQTIVEAQSATWGATATIAFDSGNPAVVNSQAETAFAANVVKELVGQDKLLESPLIPGSEDFAHYLAHKPGCLLRLGNGNDSATLHNPKFDFNDDSLTTGAAIWACITERFLS